MLILNKPVFCKCSRNILTVSNNLAERIEAFYRLLSVKVDAQELLHMVTAPPDIYIEEAGFTHVDEVPDRKQERQLKLEVISQLVNRMLLFATGGCTYQDRVYISVVLERLGMKSVTGFMKQMQSYFEKTDRVLQLTESSPDDALYPEYQNKQETRRNSGRENEQKKESLEGKGQELPEEGVLTLHQTIFTRLQTEQIYREIQNIYRTYPAAFWRIEKEELQVYEQGRLAQRIQYNKVANRVLKDRLPVFYGSQNPYETAEGMQESGAEKTADYGIAAAVLTNLIQAVYEVRPQYRRQAKRPFLSLEHSFWHSADNTLARFRIACKEGNGVFYGSRETDSLVLQEVSIVEKLLRLEEGVVQAKEVDSQEKDVMLAKEVDFQEKDVMPVKEVDSREKDVMQVKENDSREKDVVQAREDDFQAEDIRQVWENSSHKESILRGLREKGRKCRLMYRQQEQYHIKPAAGPPETKVHHREREPEPSETELHYRERTSGLPQEEQYHIKPASSAPEKAQYNRKQNQEPPELRLHHREREPEPSETELHYRERTSGLPQEEQYHIKPASGAPEKAQYNRKQNQEPPELRLHHREREPEPSKTELHQRERTSGLPETEPHHRERASGLSETELYHRERASESPEEEKYHIKPAAEPSETKRYPVEPAPGTSETEQYQRERTSGLPETELYHRERVSGSPEEEKYHIKPAAEPPETKRYPGEPAPGSSETERLQRERASGSPEIEQYQRERTSGPPETELYHRERVPGPSETELYYREPVTEIPETMLHHRETEKQSAPKMGSAESAATEKRMHEFQTMLAPETIKIFDTLREYGSNPEKLVQEGIVTRNPEKLLLLNLLQQKQDTGTQTETGAGEPRLLHKQPVSLRQEEYLEEIRIRSREMKRLAEEAEKAVQKRQSQSGVSEQETQRAIRRIAEQAEQKMKQQLGSISEQVYAALERKLESEQRRRGL